MLISDAYEHDYELSTVMKSECNEGCDDNADCGCNLMSGNHKCACKRGFFGSGKKSTSGPTCEGNVKQIIFINHKNLFTVGLFVVNKK